MVIVCLFCLFFDLYEYWRHYKNVLIESNLTFLDRNGFYEFNEIEKVENHLNLQIESGIIKLFGKLLNNKEINFKNRTRMLEVYSDWHELNNTSTLEEFL